jgi:uncharacterized membrane protein YkvA (DUF1232 family)
MSLRHWADRLRRDGLTLWFAARHPGTPALPRTLCLIAVAYALSPIDLIPDFIPVLGYLDDLLLLPLMISLALRLIPGAIVAASRRQAEAWMAEGHLWPRSWAGGVAIVCVWVGAVVGAVFWIA